MTLKSSAIFVVTALASALSVKPLWAEKPDLSGTWQLDTQSSTFGRTPHPTGGSMTIQKKHNTFHISESFTYPAAQRSNEFDWKVDNRYHPVDGPATGEVLATWDGSTLIGDRRSNEGQENVRLVKSGQTLTESIHHRSERGRQHLHLEAQIDQVPRVFP